MLLDKDTFRCWQWAYYTLNKRAYYQWKLVNKCDTRKNMYEAMCHKRYLVIQLNAKCKEREQGRICQITVKTCIGHCQTIITRDCIHDFLAGMFWGLKSLQGESKDFCSGEMRYVMQSEKHIRMEYRAPHCLGFMANIIQTGYPQKAMD